MSEIYKKKTTWRVEVVSVFFSHLFLLLLLGFSIPPVLSGAQKISGVSFIVYPRALVLYQAGFGQKSSMETPGTKKKSPAKKKDETRKATD